MLFRSLQILEEYIDDFNGPVIAISHDRYFLDRIAEKIFAYEGEGKISYIPGNYSDYKVRQQATGEIKGDIKKEKAVVVKRQAEQAPKLKFSYKEKMEYEKIDAVIENLENEIQQIEEEMGSNASHYGRLQELTNEKEAKEEELMRQMERWEYLNELAEHIAKQS